jgi:two-component system chemotaxis sensor kinase CheA
MAVDNELGREQLEMLAGVFRAEAVEHIKGLAESFFALEEGRGDEDELLARAFREAHSLKGSSATLGFERVSVVTHRLEDLLGLLRRGEHPVTPAILDRALSTLDLIRVAVESSLPGDDRLSEEEQQAVAALEELTRKAPAVAGEAPDRPAAIPQEPGAAAPGRQGPARQEYIRVAEDRLDQVIAAVGELFEADIQLESFGHELAETAADANRFTETVAALQQRLDNLGFFEESIELAEQARGLHIRLRGIGKRFWQQQRALAKLVHRTQEDLRKIRLAPISSAYVTIRTQVREIARATGKQVALRLSGGEYAVDRKVLEAVEEPLIHLLRNAVDHGLEAPEERVRAGKDAAGILSIAARHTGEAVEIAVTDDGRGVDQEAVRRSLVAKGLYSAERAAELSREQLLDVLFDSGFSTQSEVSRISGRGVGLDVVKHTVERLGGEVRLETDPGVGTTITLRLPLAMSTVRCLLVSVAGRPVAIPAANVEKVLALRADAIQRLGGGEVIEVGGQHVPLGPLAETLGLQDLAGGAGARMPVAALVRFGERRFAFGVDEVIEYGQLVLKPLGDLLERVPCISGISLLGTGRLALVLSPGDLIRAAGGVSREKAGETFRLPEEAAGPRTILVTDDSIATRTLVQTLLESAGFRVLTAADGYKALDLLGRRHVDLVVTDVQMPNLDGLELTRTIKTRSALRHLPVVLVTSLGSDADKTAGMSAGADAYVVKKDLNRGELLATIRQLL